MIQDIFIWTTVALTMLLSTIIYVGGITRKWNNKKRIKAIIWTVIPMSTVMTLLVFYIAEFIVIDA